jgi:rubrerythrin
MEDCDFNDQVEEDDKIVCPTCGYKMKEFKSIKCPRCNSYLFKKCSECNKCSLF